MRQKGQFIYILPNKWMRANYGENLRNFLLENKIINIVDFGDLPVFEEATTYPCILQVEKSPGNHLFESANVETLSFGEHLHPYLEQRFFEVDSRLLQNSGWTLNDIEVQNLLEKLRDQGKPLGEYVDGKIYRGVLTGLNEAFVIDEGIKDEILTNNPSSVEVIKPFLGGRDIKRYKQPKSEKYLILFKSGDTKKIFGDLGEETAYEKMRKKYPGIMAHLEKFRTKAKKRWDKGNYWWELRSCDYYEEFEKEKVMLPDIALKTQAIIDYEGAYCANTGYIISDLNEYHLGLLNSKLLLFFYSNLTQTIRGGYFRFIRQYLEELPIKDATTELEEQIIKLVRNRISGDMEAEFQIDRLVYELYGLTEEEIEIVEKSIR